MRSSVALQTLIDAGLNGFAIELVAESINGHHQKERLRDPFSFVYKDVVFTLSLCPDRDWTYGELLKIFYPIAHIKDQDSYLIRFARTFVAANETERGFLAHVALVLIEKYSLWPPQAAPEEGEAHDADL
jgi:hypothetical protein